MGRDDLLAVFQQIIAADQISDPEKLNWHVPVCMMGELPEDPEVGDAAIVISEISVHVFNGEEWIEVDPEFEF